MCSCEFGFGVEFKFEREGERKGDIEDGDGAGVDDEVDADVVSVVAAEATSWAFTAFRVAVSCSRTETCSVRRWISSLNAAMICSSGSFCTAASRSSESVLSH